MRGSPGVASIQNPPRRPPGSLGLDQSAPQTTPTLPHLSAGPSLGPQAMVGSRAPLSSDTNTGALQDVSSARVGSRVLGGSWEWQ